MGVVSFSNFRFRRPFWESSVKKAHSCTLKSSRLDNIEKCDTTHTCLNMNISTLRQAIEMVHISLESWENYATFRNEPNVCRPCLGDLSAHFLEWHRVEIEFFWDHLGAYVRIEITLPNILGSSGLHPQVQWQRNRLITYRVIGNLLLLLARTSVGTGLCTVIKSSRSGRRSKTRKIS